ncbi:urease accessory protein UreE [Pseudorhodobacter sp. E13]|uniref:urease accessory protein UreE n=1 Tax=Pseudorhodobacter sp. E13 TaxID=2487931 RepID=UPI000F8D1C2E|nr:urease accessory protein UreE [Pseudorhodobacter sp. E13]RUS60803.1 urease accessory protein UreE [Pseudorhodobacter sp. E13]
MTAQPFAREIIRNGGAALAEAVVLDYAARILRRKRLTTDKGLSFLADLAQTTSLNDGDAFVLSDGRRIAVRAAEESVVRITGDIPRLAWHIGNRHTPCQIGADHLVICRDHVLEAMLTNLGASLEIVTQPFRPEGGAYGHGRTMGHSHGGDADGAVADGGDDHASAFGLHSHDGGATFHRHHG